MKVTLIQPPALMAVDNYSAITIPPLGIAYLASVLRQNHHEVFIIDAVGLAIKKFYKWPKRDKRILQGLTFDEIAERVPKDTEMIGLSCMFTHAWPMVRELMQDLKVKFPNVRLVTGGEHSTSMYDTVMKQAPIDFVVLGEGEETIVELLEGLQNHPEDLSRICGIAYRDKNNDIIKTERRKRILVPDEIPRPAWDLINPTVYWEGEFFQGPTETGRSMPMLATRGCPFQCTFCSSANMWTTVWKARDPKKVADEIQYYMKTFGANDFQFQDLTAIIRKDWILNFAHEIISRGLKITWTLPAGTRSEAVDNEVARSLLASGCKHMTYAPESGSERILESIKKKVKLDRLESSTKACLDAGMGVCLFMIIGFPEEQMSDIRKTFKWIRRMAQLGVHEISMSTFVPLPGTELFSVVKKQHPFDIDDDYCHWMTGATSLMTVKSWNTRISDRKLLMLKLWGIAQFYCLSYFFYPKRLWKLIRNAFTQKQETKVDRVLHEFIFKIPLWFRLSKTAKVHK